MLPRLLAAFSRSRASPPSRAGASAATKKSTLPKITSVAPMQLGVGDVLTIRGTNFRPGARRNSVVFKRDGIRAVFVKAGVATRTRINVRVPASLIQYLPQVGGKPAAARFRLRVLAARFSRGYTPAAKSPRIGPAGTPVANGGGGSGAPPSRRRPTSSHPTATATAPPTQATATTTTTCSPTRSRRPSSSEHATPTPTTTA